MARRTARFVYGPALNSAQQPADQRYDNAYLNSAIGPARSVGAALEMLYADTDMMQLHVNESRQRRRGAHAVLRLDRAGWIRRARSS